MGQPFSSCLLEPHDLVGKILPLMGGKKLFTKRETESSSSVLEGTKRICLEVDSECAGLENGDY